MTAPFTMTSRDSEWRAVRIDARGWQVIDQPPPLFRRYSHQAPQVMPEPGGEH